jgi:vacuolar-type H+-ATPase subunit D/Vma8
MKTNVRVTITSDNVAGVSMPNFIVKGLDEENDMLIGMTGGGQAIMKSKERFTRYLKMLIEIASL